MNKNIIFIDWDGTLSWSKYWESLLKTDTNFEKVVNDFFTNEKKMEALWMRGKIKSENINKLISKRSNLSEELLWEIFVFDCQNMKINPYVISLIQKLKEKYTIILVTGNMDCFSRFTVPALGLDRIFDHIINSSDVGYLKTEFEGKTFIDCFAKFNVSDVSNSYLLDDLEENCKLFSKIGGNSMKINNKDDTLNYLKILLEK
jgi:FMN phosphatase YigB (HAD superfamily)